MPQLYKMAIVPSVANYVEGLIKILPRMSVIQLNLLREHYHAFDRTATASELAVAAKVEGGYPIVNSQYGRLGRMFCESNDFDPDVRPDGTFRWWAVWSSGYQLSGRGFVWIMLPEVAEALEILGWITTIVVSYPDEIEGPSNYVEGTTHIVSVNIYERSEAARRICIAYHGANCCICGISFGDVYGPTADGIIHVHHLRPLSEIGHEYTVNPVEDLRPVCPNCHAVIHRRMPPYSIEEVQSFLRLRR